MANIPSIPPLLSSTPPPLDFDDKCDAGDEAVITPSPILGEDYVGDFDTFAETLQSTDIHINSDDLSLPQTPMPLSPNFRNSINDGIVIPADSEADNVEFLKNEDPNGTKPSEAFNYCISTAIFESNSPPPLDLDAIVTSDRLGDDDFQEFCTASQESDPGGGNSSDDVQEEYSVIKTDDNLSLPSLKFDTLSISSEKFSGCSHLSPSPPLLHHEKKTQICDVLADNEDNVSPNESSQLSLDVVQLEDLEDDSSDEERHSMKKEKNTVQDENSDDFFAIHKINDDNQTVFSYTLSQNNSVSIHSKAEMKADNTEERRKGSDEEMSDFGDFKKVSVSEFISESSTKAENSITENETEETAAAQQQQFEDEFDDFQDYSEVATVPSAKENITALQQFNTQPSIVTTARMEDSEDEFGEFSDATLTPNPSVVVAVADQSINIPGPVSISNPNDKLLPILEMMFPNVGINTEKTMEAKSINAVVAEDNNKHFKLEAIDTANALDYNWTKSEVRHSLIRSLGIDSRNILFGDKWNNLVPRFAANLTFNPLEPLKPQQVLKQNDSSHSNVTQRAPALHKSKHDVPAAEFDWNTSGLVNPLDASQVHTLLLDLDQLMVVANLDKINVDSSPCCSSSLQCKTLTDSLKTITTTTATATTVNEKTSTSYYTIDGNSKTTAVNTSSLLIDGIASMRRPETENLLDMTVPLNRDPFGDDLFCARSCSTYTFDTNVNVSDNNCNLLTVDDSSACKYNNKNNYNSQQNNTTNAFVFNTRSTNNTLTTSVNTTTNDHVNLIDMNNHHFDTHNCLTTTTTTNAHIDTIQTTYFNAVYANAFGPITNHVTINQSLDCRSKEVSCGRKTETVHTSQSGAFNASTDSQSSRSIFASTGNEDAGKLAINSDLNATPASSAAADPATTTTISPFITTDSIGYINSDSGNNTDLSVGLQIESDLITNIIPVPLTTSTFVVKDTSYNLVQSTSFKNSTQFDAENAFDCKADFSENNVDEVVATSTFAGPLKETHIYTPSKQDSAAATKAVGLTTKTAPIDFDYEIAAAGIRINEKVVKKEYRDVEYNPGFGLSSDLQTITDNSPKRSDLFTRKELENHASSPQSNDVSELDDEFSDFQYVSPEQLPPSNLSKDMKTSTQSTQSVDSAIRSKDSAPTFSRGEMILSPSILLPQAIPLQNNKPKIEWGDTTANINPEELARIEELFPQPKTETSLHKATTQQNGYQHQTSVNQPVKSLSISASVAQKEHQVDDDDWSEFVSVPVVQQPSFQQQQQTNPKLIKFNAPNNNLHMASCVNRHHQQTTKPNEIIAASEEEWSDFVSSTPHLNTDYRTLPQFNSAAWQNANFYNNPLSFYQNQNHANGVPMHKNNNNSMISNFNCNKVYKQYDQSHYQQHQEVHIMPDFSTAPPSQRRSPITPIASERNTQFQVGTAKVAPSISLIPDLGFVAPSVPTHTAFVNTLPKPGYSMNK